MVVFEEILEEEEDQTEKPNHETAKTCKLKKGFLEQNTESLYPPEGSPEGHVSSETHKAHAENKLNQDMNKSMNRGAENNNGIERPSWYTKEWPKDCQYNAPGCSLHDMETSGYTS